MKNKIKIVGLAALCSLFLVACTSKKPEDQNNNKDNSTQTIVGETIYVSPTGTYDGAGTKESPKDFMTVAMASKPGDTILMLDGFYEYNYRLGLSQDGAYNGYITVKPASENDRVVFDFSKMTFNGSNRGIQIYGDYWHFQDIEVTGAGDNGMYIAGSYNIIERCSFYNNSDTGLQLGRAYSEDTTIDKWPSYNLIKNCTSFANYDEPTFGENADGFAAKLTIGFGNVFDGCIAFRNSDDGWDLYAKEDSGNIGTVILYNCVSFENGYLPYQIDRVDGSGNAYKSYDTMNGDGIGFKLGGSTMEGDVLLKNCMAFNNKLHGFGDNSNPGVISINNCTAFNNCMGINEDGTVGERGINGIANKSNNIDLARSVKSYNNYYGVLSYVNNQKNFASLAGDNSYNKDAFRGSAAYSIFQTAYTSGKEDYVTFTGYEDASSYHSNYQDLAFSSGTPFTGLSDDSFESLEPINAKCTSSSDIASLNKYHKSLRNEDASVNMGKLLKVKDEALLTYANGKPIGADLSKSSASDYPHYDILNFASCKNADEASVEAAYNAVEILGDANAIYQDFEIAKLVGGCDVNWTSSNNDVLKVENEEKISVSKSAYSKVVVTPPNQDVEVKLTATITLNSVKKEKEFTVIVKGRNQSIGGMASTKGSAIRVDVYNNYIAPRVYPIDASSNTNSELPLSLYDLAYTYRYATDGNSKFYPVDQVYTSVPGVYEVTATATFKSNANNKASLKFNVYVVDPDCNIDFINNVSEVNLNRDGFVITGNLSNIYGDIYAITSKTPLNITAEELIENPDVQKIEINTDVLSVDFLADNNAGESYYGYYVVANKNLSSMSKIYSFGIDVETVTTHDEFKSLAATGLTGTEKGTALNNVDTTIKIYNLMNDLDFAEYEWTIPAKGILKPFTELLNGQNHTIKNISIEGSSADKNINVFYKIQKGTIMNLNFENISMINTDATNGKIVGIIGDLQGGYLHNIKMKNISAKGRESIGALVGQVTGGISYISQCSLVNDKTCVISASNKYAGGIVGNAQMNSDQSDLKLTVTDCYVNAKIGDGNDAGGNTGGIIGRVKNESIIYSTIVERCYFTGVIQGKGQYNAGIVGDFDNGLGYVRLQYNISDVEFIYDGQVLNAKDAYMSGATQEYAHKNSNPIVGRSVWANGGVYDTQLNIGTWREYYSQYIISLSSIFDLSVNDEGQFEEWKITRAFAEAYLKFDFENVWEYDENTSTLTLK